MLKNKLKINLKNSSAKNVKDKIRTDLKENLRTKKVTKKKINLKPIQVFPQGIAMTGDDLTSFVLFKDGAGKITFPVWCPVMPFGIINPENEINLKNPYDLAHVILKELNYKLKNCTFDQVKNDEQLATLKLEIDTTNAAQNEIQTKDSAAYKNLKVKAYEALAICSSKKEIEFFATSNFIQKTRDVAVQEKGSPSQLLRKDSFLKSRQKYIM